MNAGFLSDSTIAFSHMFVIGAAIVFAIYIALWWSGCVREDRVEKDARRRAHNRANNNAPWPAAWKPSFYERMAKVREIHGDLLPKPSVTRKTDAELVATGRFYIGSDGCLKMKRTAGATIVAPICTRIQRTEWN